VPRFDEEDSHHTVERFYREARAAAGLNHPNVYPVDDVGQVRRARRWSKPPWLTSSGPARPPSSTPGPPCRGRSARPQGALVAKTCPMLLRALVPPRGAGKLSCTGKLPRRQIRFILEGSTVNFSSNPPRAPLPFGLFGPEHIPRHV
jgi:hypothetical protein